jgi:hypothetical protein
MEQEIMSGISYEDLTLHSARSIFKSSVQGRNKKAPGDVTFPLGSRLAFETKSAAN